MKKLIWILPVAVLASCAGGWNQEDKSNYMRICRSSASSWSISPEMTDSYCYCALEKTMSHYPKVPDVVINKDSIALAKELEQCKVMAGAQ